MRFTLKSILPAILVGMVISYFGTSATLDVPNNFTAGTKIVASQMNANFNAVESWSTQIASDNIVDGGIASQDIASSAVITAKIADLAVTTGKINDLAVTEAKLAAGSVTDSKLSISAIATANIATAAVVNAKIASNTITKSKLSNGTPGSNSFASCSSSSTTETVCATLEISPTGRPYLLAVIGTTDATNSLNCSNTASSIAVCQVLFRVGGTGGQLVARQQVVLEATASQNNMSFPPSAFWTIYTPGTLLNNTISFSVGVAGAANTTATLANAQFIVVEL